MRSSPATAENRREFFRAALRYSLLGLVGAGSALAGRKRLTSRQRCVNRGICSGCVAFSSCGLPAALSAKQVKGERT